MERRFNFWVYISRSTDAPKTWVAHCLRLDVVSQGDSPAHARQSIEEAVQDILLDDLNQGLDPLDRKRAPHEYFCALEELMEIGRPVDLGQDGVAERERVSRFAVLISYKFTKSLVGGSGTGLLPLAGEFKPFGANDAAA